MALSLALLFTVVSIEVSIEQRLVPLKFSTNALAMISAKVFSASTRFLVYSMDGFYPINKHITFNNAMGIKSAFTTVMKFLKINL